MRVLVLCTGNSCRSQMAEGFLRNLLGKGDIVASAGLNASTVNGMAIKVMAEIGIDISGHTSNSLTEYLDDRFDFVITVCDNAAANCPVFPGSAVLQHWPFDDPAESSGSDEEMLNIFRTLRDKIGARMKNWVDSLLSAEK